MNFHRNLSFYVYNSNDLKDHLKKDQSIVKYLYLIMTGINQIMTKTLCFGAFQAIRNHFLQKNQNNFISALPIDSYPLFVTFKKNGQLRGCIGTFSPLPLQEGIQKYALAASFQDSRFPPIKEHELNSLSCTVSILHSFIECSYTDWEIGRHGILIEYKGYRATFLPEVATEQKWNRFETFVNLMKKAGINLNPSISLFSKFKITRYQSSTISASYAEFIDAINSLEDIKSL